MKKYLKILSLIIFLWLFFPGSIKADSDFKTGFSVIYLVKPDTTIDINQEITITNQSAQVYVTSYNLELAGTKIDQIKAWDDQGSLPININQEKELTKLTINFSQPVVGKDKSHRFYLQYRALDLAKKDGQVWQIMVPQLAAGNLPDEYLLTLSVPKFLGNPTYLNPQPDQQSQSADYNSFYYGKEKLIQDKILATFGNLQIFDFKLLYHLENPYPNLGRTEIALPPDTAWQQINLQQLEPQPKNLTIDRDGNWLAEFELQPNQKIDVQAIGQALIFANPREEFLKLKLNNLEKNLEAQKYWEIDQPQIRQIAQGLKTPENIYRYVLDTLSYNQQRVNTGVQRLGAITALNQPDQAICMEFTDLFIALARAAGIPAREINGYAYTEDEKLRPLGSTIDVLHAWPEYYDSQKSLWQPVDPTWEKTSQQDYFHHFDLNHLVLAIHGENSQSPLAAGSYKQNDLYTKDVQISFGEVKSYPQTKFQINFEGPKSIVWFKKYPYQLIVKNSGSIAAYNQPLKLTAENLNLTKTDGLPRQLNILLPGAQVEFNFEVSLNQVFSHQSFLEAEIGQQKINFPIKSPFNFLTSWLFSDKN